MYTMMRRTISKQSKFISDYLGLFLVDRIPLVFQQANAIRQDTGLKVIGLCSENITMYQIHKVLYHLIDR